MRMHTRLDHLKDIIAKWRKLPGVNKQFIATCFIEQVDRHQMRNVLAQIGIAFTDSGNIFNDAQRNAEKLFRWLGEMDISEQPNKLFFVEDLIVCALPDALRTEYLNRVYSKAGVYISVPEKQESGCLNIAKLVSSLIKENSEAQIALHSAASSLSPRNLLEAEKELLESVSISQAALETIKDIIKKNEIGINQLKAV